MSILLKIYYWYTSLLIKISYKIEQKYRKAIENKINNWDHIKNVYDMLDEQTIKRIIKINITDNRSIVAFMNDGS